MAQKVTLKGTIHMASHKSKSGNTYITAELDTGGQYPEQLIIFKKAIDENSGITDLQDKEVEIEAYANQYSVQSIRGLQQSQPHQGPAANDFGYQAPMTGNAVNTPMNDKPETPDLKDLPF